MLKRCKVVFRYYIMKGIILAAGRGTRLYPCTKVTSKTLLPVYNRPMIYYPLNTLLKAGITEILFIISQEHSQDYIDLLGDGSDFKAHFTYEIQKEPRGIPEGFIIAEHFIGADSVAMILGDNIFIDDVSEHIRGFTSGAEIFAKTVSDPERFGVVEVNDTNQAISIEEKPTQPKSNLAITGLYLCDNRVAEIAKQLGPSARGELEITDIHRWYMERGELKVKLIYQDWIDAGTFDSLLAAQTLAKDQLQPLMII